MKVNSITIMYHVSSVIWTASLLDAMRVVVILFTHLTGHDTNSCTNTICM